MDDLRKQIKDYNQSVIDLAFGCLCDSCPRCKKKFRVLPDMISHPDNSGSVKAT